MHHRTINALLIGIPLYVFFVFTTTALAPVWERLTGSTPSTPGQVTLTFVGDMMFDRYVRERAQTQGYAAILAAVTPLFASSTYVFGNLEGPITTFAPVSNYREDGPNHYRFTFATDTATLLATHHFGAVSLGNNHLLDFGPEGLTQTKEWLLNAGVGYTGAPDDPYTPWYTATSGTDIVMYAYTPWYTTDLDTFSARIAAEATTTLVIVLAHWGEEYASQPTNTEIALAHQFVDAGADLIIGSHPHVIQPKEYYRDVPIYYSLGNFVFDQYFSDSVRCGAMVSYTRTQDGRATTSESFIELREDGITIPSTCATSVPVL